MATKITPVFEREILRRSAEGLSTRQLAAWLFETHAVKVTHQAIGLLLKRTQESRADAAKSVVREAMVRHLVPDLDRLEEIRKEAAKRAGVQTDDEVWVKLAKVEADVIDRKLKASGADTPDAPSDTAGVRVFLPPEA